MSYYPTVFASSDKWSICLGLHYAPNVCGTVSLYWSESDSIEKLETFIKSIDSAKAEAERVLAEQRTLQLVQKGEVA